MPPPRWYALALAERGVTEAPGAANNPSGSLAARSYLSWGTKLDAPRQGCIVVLKRGKGWQGHVTFFDREENGRLICLGGNQSDNVCFAAYRKSLVLGYRWAS
jgi:uncharacterized protein (TIGR02594 family)